MIEKLVEMQLLFYCAGAAIFLGVAIKVIVGTSLKRLVGAAGNMSKSNHALMRLVRAKYEHACMVSDKVHNVPAFVEKYLYEYRIFKIRLYALRQLEKTMIWLCGFFSLIGGTLAYYINREILEVQRYAVLGGSGVVFLILLQVTAVEKSRLEAIKMYMIEFLENTYAHRYEKLSDQKRENNEEAPQKEVIVEPQKVQEIPPNPPQENPVFPKMPQAEPELQPVQAAKIREILEEFLT